MKAMAFNCMPSDVRRSRVRSDAYRKLHVRMHLEVSHDRDLIDAQMVRELEKLVADRVAKDVALIGMEAM